MVPEVLNRQQIRRVDQLAIDKYGIPSLVLMENAGRGVVDLLLTLDQTGPFLICCGKGNNAGDGFVIARHLDGLGYDVEVLLYASPDTLVGEAQLNFAILTKTDIPCVRAFGSDRKTVLQRAIDRSNCVVDSILGTGARGGPRPPLDDVIGQLNDAKLCRVAVDVPSGLDCDTGAVESVAIRADHTCTFVAPKPGLLVDFAKPFVGQLHVVDVGIPMILIRSFIDVQ